VVSIALLLLGVGDVYINQGFTSGLGKVLVVFFRVLRKEDAARGLGEFFFEVLKFRLISIVFTIIIVDIRTVVVAAGSVRISTMMIVELFDKVRLPPVSDDSLGSYGSSVAPRLLGRSNLAVDSGSCLLSKEFSSQTLEQINERT
jgi:hypothetical protein